MASGGLTRRSSIRLISGGAAAAALAYTLGVDQTAAASQSEELTGSAPFRAIGQVIAASANKLTVSTSDGIIEVFSGENTRAYAGVLGNVRNLAAFIPGDRVLVEGNRSTSGTESYSLLRSAVFSVLYR